MPGHRRGPWSNAEDAYLMQLVQVHGALNWVRIAQALSSRTPKQCRERYHQNLKPTLNHDPITPEEGLQIERLVDEIGKRWAEIARRLHGRSDNAVKNWWNGSQNRRKRLDRRRAVQSRIGYDDAFPRPGLAPGMPSLPPPRMSSEYSPTQQRPQVSWVEAPLPSPCFSDSADSDTSSNYTTSPAGPSASLYQQLELPPLRSLPKVDPDAEVLLPSFKTLASPRRAAPSDVVLSQGARASRLQLPTAPNSPTQQQKRQQDDPRAQRHSSENESSPSDRDSRMNVAHLLG